jgi:replicative DNA helicase
MLSDKASERAVLSGICKHGPKGYFEVSDLLDSSVFTDTKNQLIYKCLEHLLVNDYAIIDVPGILSAANSLRYESELFKTKEDTEFIRSLFNFPVEVSNMRSYAEKITKLSIARDAKAKLQKAFYKLEEITGEEEIHEIIDIAESPYAELMKSLIHNDDGGDIGEGIENYINNKLENPVKNIGIPSPFPVFNNVIGDGFRPGVHLVAARFKVGKSSFAKEIGMHISMTLKIPVLYIDTEMQEDEQKDRILASLSMLPLRKVEKGDLNQQEKDKLIYAGKQLKNIKFKHERVSGKPFKEIISIMKRWINHKVGYAEDGSTNPHFIIYDYFKLMDTGDLKNMQEYQAMGFQVAALHDFCADNKTPILSFVQINRDGLTKDTTDVIAQSDRLGWNCISVSLWKRKTPEEIGQDGPKAGTHKLIPLEGRFMSKLDAGDWINYHFDEDKSKIIELGRRYEHKQEDS